MGVPLMGWLQSANSSVFRQFYEAAAALPFIMLIIASIITLIG